MRAGPNCVDIGPIGFALSPPIQDRGEWGVGIATQRFRSSRSKVCASSLARSLSLSSARRKRKHAECGIKGIAAVLNYALSSLPREAQLLPPPLPPRMCRAGKSASERASVVSISDVYIALFPLPPSMKGTCMYVCERRWGVSAEFVRRR